MARIKMIVGANEFEAEGDEDFLKSLYNDFKIALSSANQPEESKEIPLVPIEASTNKTQKKRQHDEKQETNTRKKRTKSVSADRSLNLHPQGKLSFAAFVAEKNPSSNSEKNVVCVYYLTEVIGQPGASVAQVVTCYDDQNWRMPADIKNSLQYTSSVNGWINTENSEEITMEVKGLNFVKHDMAKAVEEK